MKAKLSYKLSMIGAVLTWGGIGCSTTKVAELPPVPLNPPGYVTVPHPEGLDIGDLMAIFTDRAAPAPEELKECDAPYKSLRAKTQSKDELDQGAREMVKLEPLRFHWCFYGKLWDMEEQLGQMVYLDEKQKLVLDRYLFLTPIARAFMAEFHDTRYLRWAVTRYRKLSEHVFYRKVELGPQSTMELAGFSNPFGLVKPPSGEVRGVLEKYGITREIAAAAPLSAGTEPPTAQLPGQLQNAQAPRTPAADGTTPEATGEPKNEPVSEPSGSPVSSAVEPGNNPVVETASKSDPIVQQTSGTQTSSGIEGGKVTQAPARVTSQIAPARNVAAAKPAPQIPVTSETSEAVLEDGALSPVE